MKGSERFVFNIITDVFIVLKLWYEKNISILKFSMFYFVFWFNPLKCIFSFLLQFPLRPLNDPVLLLFLAQVSGSRWWTLVSSKLPLRQGSACRPGAGEPSSPAFGPNSSKTDRSRKEPPWGRGARGWVHIEREPESGAAAGPAAGLPGPAEGAGGGSGAAAS